MKCMNYEKMRGFRAHTKGLNLKWIKILMGRRILVKSKSLDQERREKDRDIWVKSKPSWTSCKYRNRRLNRLIRYQGGVENKSSIDQEVSRSINGKTISIDRWGIKLLPDKQKLQKKARWIELSMERYREKPKNSR